MLDLLTGGWAKLIGLLAAGGAILFAILGIRKSGRDAERARNLQATADRTRQANEARDSVADSDVDRLLTKPGDRH